MTEKATFAAGCFWGVEATFKKVRGVVSTTVGYTGGRTKDPTYEQICTDRTGHAEAVEIEFDPMAVSYMDLLGVFWSSHDPTTKNRQGPDFGSQYRSAIFYHSDEQRDAALRSMQEQEQARRFNGRQIVTEIVQATEFYPAEEYHQDYHEKHGLGGCRLR
jgi:peptide-methionine (S)-S-oxide reductase